MGLSRYAGSGYTSSSSSEPYYPSAQPTYFDVGSSFSNTPPLASSFTYPSFSPTRIDSVPTGQSFGPPRQSMGRFRRDPDDCCDSRVLRDCCVLLSTCCIITQLCGRGLR